MMVKSISVLLVDDHAMVRSGIKTFLKFYEGMELFAEAQDGEEALKLCESKQPDVILMDLMMPNMDGITATREIKARWPDIKIIALTSFDQKDMVSAALKAGAIGYLLKTASAEELADTIRMTAAGRSVLSPRATQSLISEDPPKDAISCSLTEKELEILSQLVRGSTNKEISEQLMLGISTIKFHVSNILSKLGAQTRTEAATLAIKYKLA
jgi:two-component system, NarL family, response regulator LiaR